MSSLELCGTPHGPPTGNIHAAQAARTFRTHPRAVGSGGAVAVSGHTLLS